MKYLILVFIFICSHQYFAVGQEVTSKNSLNLLKKGGLIFVLPTYEKQITFYNKEINSPEGNLKSKKYYQNKKDDLLRSSRYYHQIFVDFVKGGYVYSNFYFIKDIDYNEFFFEKDSFVVYNNTWESLSLSSSDKKNYFFFLYGRYRTIKDDSFRFGYIIEDYDQKFITNVNKALFPNKIPRGNHPISKITQRKHKLKSLIKQLNIKLNAI